MLLAAVAVILVALDQFVKYWVKEQIPLYGARSFLEGFIQLTHVQNLGAAWSTFSGMRWVLVSISAVVSVAIVVLLSRRIVRYPLGRWALTIVLAGAVGNLIDRAIFGYVTDMFRFQFFEFPVFNVADMCVVIGGILTGIYYVFFYEKHDGKRERRDEAAGD
ncbi:signal peptidase II [Papillibacter cinnamivorans]|uniref:Lipoprotein signal peptidase n=1 Tax=Papillibacter cinnamivorans DSM 12816 TaxID=1122930 RepID=A0A1W2A5H6_9FIRM|nr:signal peptidase II [Papillibacter cinnamivorans]SMC55900.1 signal peptidase II [Papillibacter cinnamivorans DSM 12816]